MSTMQKYESLEVKSTASLSRPRDIAGRKSSHFHRISMFHHAMHNSSRELFESPPGSPRSCDRLAQTAPSGSLRPRSPASGFGGTRYGYGLLFAIGR